MGVLASDGVEYGIVVDKYDGLCGFDDGYE